MDARPRGPNSFIFMQFSVKNLQNNLNLGMAHPPWENPGSATAESSFIHTEAIVILVTSGISSNFLSHSCWILINFKMGVNVAFARCVLQKGVKFADDNITQHIRSTTITGSQWSTKGSHPLANCNYKSSNFRVLRL